MQLHDNSIYIVPNPLKMRLLEYLMTKNEVLNITFYTLEEFLKYYLYKIKDEAVLYLLENTNENYETIKTILHNLYQLKLSSSFEYHLPKLKKLKDLLSSLKDNDYLEYDETFKEYLKTKNIYVLGYDLLEPYQLDIFKEVKANIIQITPTYKLEKVYKYPDLKAEVIGIATKIRELNLKGVSYDKIFLAGIDNNYDYVLKNVFAMFNIPLNYQEKKNGTSILSIKEYLKTGDLAIIKNEELKSQVLRIEEKLLYAKDSKYYHLLLSEALKDVGLKEPVYKEAVQVLNEALEIPFLIKDDEYLFVLGFNQNKLPRIYKDEDYLSDKAKTICGLNTAAKKNILNKESLLRNLETVKNLFLSYKLATLTTTEAKSSLLSELDLEEISVKTLNNNYNLSRQYNNYKTALVLDTYYKFHEEDPDFNFLISNINFSFYNSYHHNYTPITRSLTPYNLSYSSIDDLAKCPFKYYLKYILKIDTYQKSLSQKIGDIFHYVLKASYNSNFDFEKSYLKALENETLDLKEAFFLTNLKEKLRFIVNTNKEREKRSFLTNFYGEKKLELKLSEEATLKGFIDKILYNHKNNCDYYAVFDYKTGSATLNLDYLEEGLFLQLPLYIYLINRSNLFANPTFVGFFYQMLLQNSKNEEEALKNLKLVGYTTTDFDRLYYLDEDYSTDSFVKGLALTKEGALSARSKTLTDSEVEKMLSQIDKLLQKYVTMIKENSFEIAPKILKGDNISCKYCPYKDICFTDPSDNIYLDQQEKEGDLDA